MALTWRILHTDWRVLHIACRGKASRLNPCTTPKPTPPPAQHRRLQPTTIARRDLTENDVQIEILFCGICHSDLHQARNEWSALPHRLPLRARSRDCRPRHQSRIGGHQIQGGRSGRSRLHGRLLRRPAKNASNPWSSSCANGTLTYNFPDKHTGGVTYGGYSDSVVCQVRI